MRRLMQNVACATRIASLQSTWATRNAQRSDIAVAAVEFSLGGGCVHYVVHPRPGIEQSYEARRGRELEEQPRWQLLWSIWFTPLGPAAGLKI